MIELWKMVDQIWKLTKKVQEERKMAKKMAKKLIQIENEKCQRVTLNFSVYFLKTGHYLRHLRGKVTAT